jgi:pyrroloquinoline quinone biosynthesis protein D
MLRPVELLDRPRLARRARVRFDRISGAHLLLSPERGLVLNDSAAAIVVACSGINTVRQIVGELSDELSDAADVETDVLELLTELRRRGLIEVVGAS